MKSKTHPPVCDQSLNFTLDLSGHWKDEPLLCPPVQMYLRSSAEQDRYMDHNTKMTDML